MVVFEVVGEGGVGEAELFEEPEDALGLGVLEVGRRGLVGAVEMESRRGVTDVEVVEGGFAWGGHCGGEGYVEEEEEAVDAGSGYV